jgi:hypothetical protein
MQHEHVLTETNQNRRLKNFGTMIKILLLFVLCVVISAEWETNSFTNVRIRPSEHYGHFIANFKKIRFQVSCTEKCDVYFLTQDNLFKLRQGQPFQSYSQYKGVYNIRDSFENVTDFESDKFALTTVNPSSVLSLTVKFSYDIFVEGYTRGRITLILLVSTGFMVICAVCVLISLVVLYAIPAGKKTGEEISLVNSQ